MSLRPNELDYVIDGAISGDGEKYQINVRLLDLTKYARPVWSERFELGVDELYRSTRWWRPIVGRIDPLILFIEGQPKRRDKAGATSLIMQAMPMIYSWEREKFEKAGELIDEALRIEPDNAMVLAWAAHWRMSHVGPGLDQESGAASWSSPKSSRLKATQDRSGQCGGAWHLRAHLLMEEGLRRCAALFRPRAALEPESRLRLGAERHHALLHWQTERGAQTHGALPRARAVRSLFLLFETHLLHAPTCCAATTRRPLVYGRRCAKANPQFINGYKPLIASLGHLGELDEARTYIDKLLDLEPQVYGQTVRPDLSVQE